MKTAQRLLKRLGQFTAQASLVSVMAVGLPATAGAAEVTVDCDGPANFGSINDALAALSLEGPNTIFVLPGNCVENVVIDNRERLTIDAPDGLVAINATDGDQPVITIRDSRSITLRALAVYSSNQNGIAILRSSGVDLSGNHSISNGAAGYFVEGHSSVYFSSHATDNGSDGLFVWEGSQVLLEGGATLTGNGGFGIFCRDGSTCILKGNVVIENNGSVGLVAVNNTLIKVHSNSGPNTVQGNAFFGIYLARNSVADLRGDYENLVTANSGPGIHLETNSSLGLFNSTISNNTGPGVELLRHSVAEIVGTNAISDNGGANLACDSTSLIHGNLNEISKINCQRIERAMGPPRPGKIN